MKKILQQHEVVVTIDENLSHWGAVTPRWSRKSAEDRRQAKNSSQGKTKLFPAKKPSTNGTAAFARRSVARTVTLLTTWKKVTGQKTGTQDSFRKNRRRWRQASIGSKTRTSTPVEWSAAESSLQKTLKDSSTTTVRENTTKWKNSLKREWAPGLSEKTTNKTA